MRLVRRAAGLACIAVLLPSAAAAQVPPASVPGPTVAQGSWRLLPATQRSYHTATRLADGKVLVTGGCIEVPVSLTHPCFQPSTSAELFDPARNRWLPAASMLVPRASHTATLLRDGRVLVAGGFHGYESADGGQARAVADFAELYDPRHDRWTAVPRPLGTTKEIAGGLFNHSATLLDGPACRRDAPTCGDVLVIGGVVGHATSNPLAELFDPRALRWTSLPRCAPQALISQCRSPAPTVAHGAAVIADGRVLFTGHPNSQLYDPATRTWTDVPQPNVERSAWFTLTPVNGSVLLTGGFNGQAATPAVETFDAGGPSWQLRSAMASPRFFHAAAPLPGGRVLVAGGSTKPGEGEVLHLTSSAEVFDPRTGQWSAAAPMRRPRGGDFATSPVASLSSAAPFSATALDDGRVLVVGAADATAELYTPTGLPGLPSAGAATGPDRSPGRRSVVPLAAGAAGAVVLAGAVALSVPRRRSRRRRQAWQRRVGG